MRVSEPDKSTLRASYSVLPLMFHSVPWKGWLYCQGISMALLHEWFWRLSAYLNLKGRIKGRVIASQYVIQKNYLESRYSAVVWILYWGMKLKTITERHRFVVLTCSFSSYVFMISSYPNFIRELAQQSLIQLKVLERQKQKFIAIHSGFVFLNPRLSRKLRTFIEWLRATGSRAVSWADGRVDEKSGVFGGLCAVYLLVAF